jgi:hypothetical protein
MYRDEDDKARILEKYRTSDPDVAEGLDEEFYWDVQESERMLSEVGWKTTCR